MIPSFSHFRHLIERFDVARISKSPAIFDETKLKHLNSLHLRAMAPESFHELALKHYPEAILQKLRHEENQRVDPKPRRAPD